MTGTFSRRKPYLLPAGALLLGAFAFRVWDLTAQSIWFDEGVAIYAASHPLPEIAAADPTNPPLYYYLLHTWTALVGGSDFAVRALPVLLGMTLVAGTWALGRAWFGPAVGVAAALLAACSPYFWWYAQEARMYGLLALEVLALVFLVEQLRAAAPKGSGVGAQRAVPLRGIAQSWAARWPWAAALALETAALLTHNLGPVVAAWLNLALVLSWLAARRWRALAGWLAAQAALLAALAPWLLGRGRFVTGLSSVTHHPPTPADLLAGWESLFAGSWALAGDDKALAAGSSVLLLLAAGGVAALLLDRRGRGATLLAHVALLLALIAGLLYVGGFGFHARYLSLVAAPLVVLIAASAVAAARLSQLAKALAVAGLALTLVLFVYSRYRTDVTPAYQRDDARAMSRYYAQTLHPGDIVVSPYGRDYALWRYGVGPATLVEIDLGQTHLEAARDALNAKIESSARVEVLDWDKIFGDRRGALGCLLEGNGRRASEPFAVVGYRSQGYMVQAPLALPAAQPLAADFGPVQLEAVAFTPEAPADQARCVTLHWRLAAPVAHDLRMAVSVVNALGWEIARADGPLLRDDFAPTSRWAAGERAASYAVIRLPAGTPPGAYPLRARLYHEGAPSGLDVLVAGAPSGKDAALGVLAVTPATHTPELTHADTLTPLGAPLGGGLTLDAYAAPDGTVHPGEMLRVTLRWRVEGAPVAPVLRLSGADWRIERAGAVEAAGAGGLALDWREITVPADAPPGPAVLAVAWQGNTITLSSLTVEESTRLMAPPPFGAPVGIEFPGVGVLAGFTVEADAARISPREALPLTLVWQATGTPATAYTVFTHALDAEGRLIAGHDAPPARGARPTTGWLPGEYIIDAHALAFTDAAQGYTGPASLEVGLYDAATGARALTASGADHVILPVELAVIDGQ